MIRLALVGCGGMQGVHAERMPRVGGRAAVTATVDIDPAAAQSAAALFPDARWATAVEEVLDDVDAVLLALPHHVHHSVGMACLKAGKHVLMEKPLALTDEECLELIEEAERGGLVLMTAYPMRYQPLVAKMKELIDAKTYGELFQMAIWTEQMTKYPDGHWATSAATLGGGQLFSHGCHYIDLLLWFMGRPIEGAHLGTNLGTPWMEREGTSNVTIRFDSGAVGYHFGTWGARGTRLGYSIHAHCTEGMLEARFAEGRLLVHTAPWGTAIVPVSPDQPARSDTEKVLLESEVDKYTENELMHFLDCVETGAKPLTDAYGSLQGLRVIWRLYEAEETGVLADLRGLGLDDPIDTTASAPSAPAV